MVQGWKDFTEKIMELSGKWTAFTALGSFLLYALGYLTLRFHLTALGVGTDLTVLDERYLFAGANFLIYFVSAVPIVLLLLIVPAALGFLPYRLLPLRIRSKIQIAGSSFWQWITSPGTGRVVFTLAGIVFSVIVIQFFMRQCFLFSNLLLCDGLPDPAWLRTLLLDDKDGLRSLYFAGLLAASAVPLGISLILGKKEQPAGFSQFLQALLGLLTAIQFLMLPVNYGILIMDRVMPRVESMGEQKLSQGQTAWLVWEGKEGMTYLLRTIADNGEQKALVTLPRKDVKETRIIAYDPILRTLFAHQVKQKESTGRTE
ncbi:hypothetical protein SAMN04489760_10637 [Syntrophus gentianae]|uniref:Uncharacterized protein n=1 Tax=Syntrophus gentianae TaxID=43775 RepID=A0A1H7WBY8_9BACT|nr:hypothetical protein [Syntrophus gentianae]SEM18447.1 hypothetical protein SAMN04489760_10637 [Syntrophus gentianae]